MALCSAVPWTYCFRASGPGGRVVDAMTCQVSIRVLSPCHLSAHDSGVVWPLPPWVWLRKWEPPLPEPILAYLAGICAGFCWGNLTCICAR